MRKKILFVDDEGDWRFIPSLYLKDAGYDVLTAKNGTDALFQSQDVQLSLIILDIHLAGENGVTLMRLFKRNHPHVPIILYTGHEHDEASVAEMLKEGAYQYLRKGTMGDLLKAVQGALGELPAAPPPPDFSV